MSIKIKINHLNPYKNSFGDRWKVYEFRGLTRVVVWTYTNEKDKFDTT